MFHSISKTLLYYLVHISKTLKNKQTGIAKMSEDGSSSTSKRQQNLSNLPRDILSKIADGLGLMELMNLRRVCKDWGSVSSKALLKQVHESFERDPWFLLYDGESSKCSLLSKSDKICTATIPELEGATCLASHEGWLLVFRGGSMFFFCPFSMAKIDLPSCPFTELSGHAAAFSAPPTSQDCKVAVIRRSNDTELELHLLSRGHDVWAKHSCYFRVQQFGTIMAALCSEGAFHFLDNLQGLVTFDAATETKKWNRYRLIKPSEHTETIDSLKYGVHRGMLSSVDFNKLGLDKNKVSISSCGTLYLRYTDSGSGTTDHEEVTLLQVIPDESIEADIGSESTRLKGVWILPRYHTPSMDHRW